MENSVEELDSRLRDIAKMLTKPASEWSEEDKDTHGNHERLRDKEKLLNEQKKLLIKERLVKEEKETLLVEKETLLIKERFVKEKKETLLVKERFVKEEKETLLVKERVLQDEARKAPKKTRFIQQFDGVFQPCEYGFFKQFPAAIENSDFLVFGSDAIN
jgi:hypothetical protein